MSTTPKFPRFPKAPRDAVVRCEAGYQVVGIATVEAMPHRSAVDAKALAIRIALRPSLSLGICRVFGVPGVIDQRTK